MTTKTIGNTSLHPNPTKMVPCTSRNPVGSLVTERSTLRAPIAVVPDLYFQSGRRTSSLMGGIYLLAGVPHGLPVAIPHCLCQLQCAAFVFHGVPNTQRLTHHQHFWRGAHSLAVRIVFLRRLGRRSMRSFATTRRQFNRCSLQVPLTILMRRFAVHTQCTRLNWRGRDDGGYALCKRCIRPPPCRRRGRHLHLRPPAH